MRRGQPGEVPPLRLLRDVTDAASGDRRLRELRRGEPGEVPPLRLLRDATRGCLGRRGVGSGGARAAAPAAPASVGEPSAAVDQPVVLPPQEVRKFVTLVFTDLKDSTALTGSIDAEAMNEIKARYFSSMAVEIERHGGKVEKNIGDAIMAVFGLIRAHEDDALRAVRAAYGMQRVLAALNEDLEKFYGVRITNRTGVNTGEIVANTTRRPTRTSRPATRSTSRPASSKTPRPARS